LVRRLETNEDAPRAARDLVAEVSSRCSLTDAQYDDLAVVVTELVTNAVVHGPPGELTVRIDASPTLLRVEVADGGTQTFTWPETQNGSHWGLELVSTFSDRVGITHSPSTLVWCELDLVD
jgi:anti-sigma regulatory factor (Ser/Thr protein kinase)